MLQRLVANWLRQQAQSAVMGALNPDMETESSESGSSEPRDVLVACFFPSSGEAGGFVDQLSNVSVTKCNGFLERIGFLGDRTVVIVESGLPHEQLAPAVRDVLILRKPKWAMACGFAVSLSEQVRRGAIVVADRIIDEQDYSLSTGTKMPESKGLHVGPLLTREALPTQSEKNKLSTKEALATETQAAIVAEVSRLQKCPMMAIHTVAQAFNERPSNILNKVKSQDSIAGFVGAAAGALLDQPSSVKEFWNDKEASLKNSDRLASFLVGVLQQLPAPREET